MYLIAGLGNPGSKYVNTRHNIGFKVLDSLAKKHDVVIKKKLFHNAKEAIIKVSGKKILCIAPLTFMNLSGDCIVKYVKKFNISLDKLLIVYDDVSIPLGSVRVRAKGTSAGHNGVESIINRLGTSSFPRLKVGIARDNIKVGLSNYVLSEFENSELPDVNYVIDAASDACECWLKYGIERTMQKYNNSI